MSGNAGDFAAAPYLGAMPPDRSDGAEAEQGFATLRRFLPYLWPSDQPALRLRIVGAMLLVVASKLVQVYGAPFALQGAVDGMARGDRSATTLLVALVVGYAAARFGSVLFDNLRNAVFERVGQDATRRLAASVFRHLHQLSLRFHLERRTGAVTKVVERGTKSIDTMLYFLLFNIAPTVLELLLVLQIFWSRFGLWLVGITVVMVAIYIAFTRVVTDWRNALRVRMNDLDTGAVAHAVDSLLNFETVKYFGAEEREAQRYDQAVGAYAKAAVKNETSLAWLNIGQSAITNLTMGLAMAIVVWGWADGRFTAGNVVLVSTLLSQLFRPLDLLGMVYRTIRQGLIDMGAMFTLIDTPAEVTDSPGARPLRVEGGAIRFEGVRFAYDPERQILRALRSNQVVAFVIDQHMPKHRGVACRFFGRYASTTPAPALFAMKTGAVVVPALIHRVGNSGRHVSQIFPPIVMEEPHADRTENLKHNMQRLNDWLEAEVRKTPGQWLWLHKRWKIENNLAEWGL